MRGPAARHVRDARPRRRGTSGGRPCRQGASGAPACRQDPSRAGQPAAKTRRVASPRFTYRHAAARTVCPPRQREFATRGSEGAALGAPRRCANLADTRRRRMRGMCGPGPGMRGMRRPGRGVAGCAGQYQGCAPTRSRHVRRVPAADAAHDAGTRETAGGPQGPPAVSSDERGASPTSPRRGTCRGSRWARPRAERGSSTRPRRLHPARRARARPRPRRGRRRASAAVRCARRCT